MAICCLRLVRWVTEPVTRWVVRFTGSRSRFAQANSLAITIRPSKMVGQPGPGNTSKSAPNDTMVRPMTKTVNLQAASSALRWRAISRRELYVFAHRSRRLL